MKEISELENKLAQAYAAGVEHGKSLVEEEKREAYKKVTKWGMLMERWVLHTMTPTTL